MTRILLIEPDALLARATCRWLGSRGYDVETLDNGVDPVAFLRRFHDVDAVLTHYGRDLPVAPLVVAECRARGIPVRVLSGAVEDPALRDIWITKPGLEEVEAWLREVGR